VSHLITHRRLNRIGVIVIVDIIVMIGVLVRVRGWGDRGVVVAVGMMIGTNVIRGIGVVKDRVMEITVRWTEVLLVQWLQIFRLVEGEDVTKRIMTETTLEGGAIHREVTIILVIVVVVEGRIIL